MWLKTAGRRTGKRRIWALPVLGAMIAAIAIGGAIPAAAAPHTIHTPDGAGSARFGEIGDHIYLCDHDGDGHGVGVYVDYIHENGNNVTDWYWFGGGTNDCRDVNLKVAEYTDIYYYVCLANHTKPGGQKPKVIDGTCSGWAVVYNDNQW